MGESFEKPIHTVTRQHVTVHIKVVKLEETLEPFFRFDCSAIYSSSGHLYLCAEDVQDLQECLRRAVDWTSSRNPTDYV